MEEKFVQMNVFRNENTKWKERQTTGEEKDYPVHLLHTLVRYAEKEFQGLREKYCSDECRKIARE